MKRRNQIILAVVAASILLILIFVRFRHSWFWPRSEVPITTELCGWDYQYGLTVTELTAEAVDPYLNLFNDRFLIRYHIKGTLTLKGLVSYSKGVRPAIKMAQITSRQISGGAEQRPVRADVLIVPIVGVIDDDAAFPDRQFPFDLKLEQVMPTMDWGANQYVIRCGDQTTNPRCPSA